MNKNILFLVFMFVSFFINAQEASQVEMADGLRSEGKIYVVVAVLVTIFGCLAFYLFKIENKVKKIEKEIKNKKI